MGALWEALGTLCGLFRVQGFGIQVWAISSISSCVFWGPKSDSHVYWDPYFYVVFGGPQDIYSMDAAKVWASAKACLEQWALGSCMADLATWLQSLAQAILGSSHASAAI